MPLIVINRRDEIKAFIRDQKAQKKKIGFIPTMGALHQGHASLIKQSAGENDISIVSIFVNPKQFGPNEDLAKYPRTFQKDCDVAEAHGAQAIFSPSIEEMYPNGFSTKVTVSEITDVLCGQFRPGHFDGVATVVLLLLNLIEPTTIYMGQKDYQQVQVIKRLCTDLSIKSKVQMVPTIREEDGLALSSRNVYLNLNAREKAKYIPKALAAAAKLFLNGERQSAKLLSTTLDILKSQNLTPQYLELRNMNNISQKLESAIETDCVLAVAQFIDSEKTTTRLIDNILLTSDSKWIQILEDFIKCTNS